MITIFYRSYNKSTFLDEKMLFKLDVIKLNLYFSPINAVSLLSNEKSIKN